MTESRPPFPPFDLDSAVIKVQAAEDAWNTRDPHRVSLCDERHGPRCRDRRRRG